MSRKRPCLGVLGGGQLARMLVLAAAPLGIDCVVADTKADVCAAQVAPVMALDWNDTQTLRPFADRIDAATFDFENVPAEAAEWLTRHTHVHPNAQALSVAQDRLAEKTLFNEIGLETAAFAPVETRAGLNEAVERIGTPAILKTRRFGYDGKGQFRLHDRNDIDAAWAELGDAAQAHGLILEAFVPFERELSVIAVRSRDGDFRAWPLTQNWHTDGVLSLSLCPAPDTHAVADAAFSHARRLAERLDYVGVFALELFQHEGRVLGNEMAPRVHNSGHWSIEGAHTSQFENHVRAVLGLGLGDTGVRGVSAMLNWIGELPDPAPVLAETEGHWHDYGKDPRPGRKVGHATLCAPDMATLQGRLRTVADALDRNEQVAPILAL